jgi:hypothetical protein
MGKSPSTKEEFEMENNLQRAAVEIMEGATDEQKQFVNQVINALLYLRGKYADLKQAG